MFKKSLYLILIATLLTSCGKFRYEVTIPKSEIQTSIAKKFPYSKNAIIAKYSIHSPEVYFKNNKVGVKVLYNGNFLNNKAEGYADCKARITFNKKRGIFYLRDFEVVDATANGKKLSENAEIKKIISEVIANKLNYYKLYKLDQNDINQQIAKLALKKIYFKGDKIHLVLGL